MQVSLRRNTHALFAENERADAVMLDTTNPDVMGLEKSTNCTFLSYLRCTFPKVANFWQQNDSIAKHEVFS